MRLRILPWLSTLLSSSADAAFLGFLELIFLKGIFLLLGFAFIQVAAAPSNF
jgi:hypothetical protein